MTVDEGSPRKLRWLRGVVTTRRGAGPRRCPTTVSGASMSSAAVADITCGSAASTPPVGVSARIPCRIGTVSRCSSMMGASTSSTPPTDGAALTDPTTISGIAKGACHTQRIAGRPFRTRSMRSDDGRAAGTRKQEGREVAGSEREAPRTLPCPLAASTESYSRSSATTGASRRALPGLSVLDAHPWTA